MRAAGHGSTHYLSDFTRVLLRYPPVDGCFSEQAGMNQVAIDDGQGQVPAIYLSKLVSHIQFRPVWKEKIAY